MGYLIGCVNPAQLFASMRGLDLHAEGSGNLGASNAMVVLGWRFGVITALLDIAKGSAAVLLTKMLFPGAINIGLVAGTAATLGHIFPFYLRFRGGKGLAAFYGMTLIISWRLALCVAIAIALITLITDYIAIGTLAASVTLPAYLFFTAGYSAALIVCAATVVMVWRHRVNLRRIMNGTEIGLRRANSGHFRK